MKTSEAKQLLETLCRHGIPLTLSVPFLVRAQGQRVQELAQQAGYHRNVLRMALEGRRNAPVRLRDELRRYLGCDPWETAAAITGPVSGGQTGNQEVMPAKGDATCITSQGRLGCCQ